ncbi:DUF6388 family protein [Pseudomonas japonica]|uniref:DUF6388 family protein n=1 Tax=Pseudomonas japonica TaxID=256466 RepID=UPI0015E3DB59|nr:DUF6388 family protein [Pseudomonas japonica]MBA1243446.1 hypothetical protein [Pseudomonas japonica]MBA1290504.1 hypothetical protein [Pseudomonas japonica]
MIPKEARQQLACDRYLAAHPELAEEIRELDSREQQQQVLWAMEDAAGDLGLEPWEYVLELIADSPEALAAMREEVHREVAEALGMGWEEYRQLNEL